MGHRYSSWVSSWPGTRCPWVLCLSTATKGTCGSLFCLKVKVEESWYSGTGLWTPRVPSQRFQIIRVCGWFLTLCVSVVFQPCIFCWNRYTSVVIMTAGYIAAQSIFLDLQSIFVKLTHINGCWCNVLINEIWSRKAGLSNSSTSLKAFLMPKHYTVAYNNTKKDFITKCQVNVWNIVFTLLINVPGICACMDSIGQRSTLRDNVAMSWARFNFVAEFAWVLCVAPLSHRSCPTQINEGGGGCSCNAVVYLNIV